MTLTPQQTMWSEQMHLPTRRWEWPSPWIDRPSTQETESATPMHGSTCEGADAPQVAFDGGSREPSMLTARPVCGPSALIRMYVERGVSPWVDHLSRDDLLNGTLSRLIAAGVRGIGDSQAGLTRSRELSAGYEEQLSWLMGTGCTVQQAYWELAATDAQAACALLGPVYEMSQGTDGFVSVQATPARPRRTHASMAAICQLHRRIDRPNVLVAIPATASGVQALRATVSAGCNINATSIFSLARYEEVVDAYQTGLEAFVARGGDPTTVHGLASFSLSPVDAEVDRRIEELGTRGPLELRGLAAVSQAALAYQVFEDQFSTERWARLARRGATPQRLVWACTGTDPESDHIQPYVDALSVPNTVQLLSASTVATLNKRGLKEPAPRINPPEAADVVSNLAALGIDLDDVAAALERQSSALAQDSLADALDRLSTRSWQR
jgi:transaldolase